MGHYMANFTIISYADYIQGHHSNFLNATASYRKALTDSSPFSDYVDVEVDDAFFGAGYTIASFPSLYDMYGKFMAGMDIEALWEQMQYSTLHSPVISDLILAESILLDDEIEETSLPRLQIGMRDINSIMSSSFIVGKSLIEDSKVKTINRFSAGLKYQLISVAQERWTTHLNWNKIVVGTYAELMKFYFSAKTDIDEINYGMAVKHKLWPFTILDFERAALGALQGATNQKTDVAGASTISKVLSGALSGAAMGAMVGGQITRTAATEAVKATATTAATSGAAATSWAGPGAIVGAGLGAAAAYYY